MKIVLKHWIIRFNYVVGGREAGCFIENREGTQCDFPFLDTGFEIFTITYDRPEQVPAYVKAFLLQNTHLFPK